MTHLSGFGRYLHSTRVHYILIILFVSLAYANILHNEFVWDDHGFIETWELTRSLENIPELLQGALPENQQGVYRPLRSVFYALSYQLWGVNSIGYHFQSILVHLVCTLLGYSIVRKITNKPLLACMSALVFAVHPIHIESISWITTSFDIIGVIFFLLSFWGYLEFKENYDSKYLYLAFITALCAFFTYEITLSLPLLIIFYEICIRATTQDQKKARLITLCMYFVASAFYIAFRVLYKAGSRGGYPGESIFYSVLLGARSLVEYIITFLVPTNTTIDHILMNGATTLWLNNKLVQTNSLFDFEIIVACVLLLLIAYVLLKNIRTYPLCVFFAGWFFIALSPVLNIIPFANPAAEKYAYIASLGACVLVAYFFHSTYVRLKDASKTKYYAKKIFYVFGILIIALTVLTIARNTHWESDQVLFSKTLQEHPNSIVSHFALGDHYLERQDYEKALHHFYEMKRIDPEYFLAHNSIAAVHYHQKNYKKAIEHYRLVLKYEKLPQYYFNLGNAYLLDEQYGSAIAAYEQALRINPHMNVAFSNLQLAQYKLSQGALKEQ